MTQSQKDQRDQRNYNLALELVRKAFRQEPEKWYAMIDRLCAWADNGFYLTMNCVVCDKAICNSHTCNSRICQSVARKFRMMKG